MSLLQQIQRWIKEPPPDYLFEVSERGIAVGQPKDPAGIRVIALPEKALQVSPAEPNVARLDLFQAAFPKSGNGRVKAALVIPDYAARMSILDFDELPPDDAQRVALLRLRLRRSVPFSIDDAQVSYSVQAAYPQQKGVEVLAATISRPVLEEYEALLRSFGYQAGLVLPSSVATLPLCQIAPGMLALLVKLSGSILSLVLLEQQRIRIMRCIDLSSEENDGSERNGVITAILQQTLAFAEDELNQPVQRLMLCGFGADAEELGMAFETEFGLSWTRLASRFGPATQENAGLLGLMEQYTA